jgi:hypothetical protein
MYVPPVFIEFDGCQTTSMKYLLSAFGCIPKYALALLIYDVTRKKICYTKNAVGEIGKEKDDIMS